MYFRKPQGLLKHWDFVLLDIVCLYIAFLIAFFIRHKHFQYWKDETYVALSFLMIVVSVVVSYFSETFKNVFKRGLYKELVQTIKQMSLVFLITVFFLYFIPPD